MCSEDTPKNWFLKAKCYSMRKHSFWRLTGRLYKEIASLTVLPNLFLTRFLFYFASLFSVYLACYFKLQITSNHYWMLLEFLSLIDLLIWILEFHNCQSLRVWSQLIILLLVWQCILALNSTHFLHNKFLAPLPGIESEFYFSDFLFQFC